jgi:7,8-dihydropterin-6-yl-methyl-4-(beta-D-ribofuranosyl)aminobenzene 5'-phosphate synthase
VTVYICPGFGKATKENLAATGAAVVEVNAPKEIREGIYTTGPIRGVYNNQDIEEQAVVVKTKQGLAVVTGCAHPGIKNILDKVAKDFGQPVSWLIGGMHLINSAPSEICAVVDELQRLGVERVSPMYCTGTVATGIIKEKFGKNSIPVVVGSSVALDFKSMK